MFDSSPLVEVLAICPGRDQLLSRLRATETPFLLESGLNPAGMGVWHLYGAYPVGEFIAFGNRWRSRLNKTPAEGEGNPWRAFDRWWKSWRAGSANVRVDLPGVGTFAHGVGKDRKSIAEHPPFMGGAVGYFSYEAGEWFEKSNAAWDDSHPSPAHAEGAKDLETLHSEIHFYLYDEVLLLHQESQLAYFIHRNRPGVDERRWWQHVAPLHPFHLTSPAERVAVSLDREAYFSAVEEIRARIRDGDVYEVNLAVREEWKGGVDPWEMYRRLRTLQPVPYAALLPWHPCGVVSASPERFLRRSGNYVETRPIKGTAPRGVDAEADRLIASKLLVNLKERAELAMIIDLERNDLGKLCRPGTVQVLEEAAVERYATVLHTVATICGELSPDVSPVELLCATFPGGSITGAPKIAAMKVIHRLEPVRRDVYTGSIGWIDPWGDLDLSIAIRTLLFQGDRKYFSLGSAITWDSNAVDEFAELAQKGKAIHGALLFGEGSPPQTPP